MKVVFLSHIFPNSCCPLNAPFMVERAKAFSKVADIEVVAPCSYFPFLRTKGPSFLEYFKGLKVWHPRYLALPEILWHWRWFPYFKMIRKTFHNSISEYDILHVEWIYPDAYAAVRFAKKWRTKTIGVVHGNEAIDYFGPRNFRKKYCKVLGQLDHIIVVSRDLEAKLVQDYGVPGRKISVILNGVAVEKFPVLDKGKARGSLGIRKDIKVGVCVARLSAEKNLDVLIKAVARLQSKSPVIFIVGNGPLRESLQKLIDSCGVTERVRLVGSVPHDDVALWLNAGDFFCLPSQREGCPVVVHEALACGRPVISTTVGAIPDLICHEDYGLLCPPSDVEALAGLLRQAVSRTWNTEKISAYGRRFTWQKVAEETVKVFHEVLS